jgi:DNA-binding transcriptional regulator YiaG
MGKKIDIEAIAKAIEADAGETLPELRQALMEAQAGAGRVTTPEQILVRQARERSGLTQVAFAERIDTPVATLRLGTRAVFSAGRRVVPAAAHLGASGTGGRA